MKKWMRAALAAWLVMLAFSSVAQAASWSAPVVTPGQIVSWSEASSADSGRISIRARGAWCENTHASGTFVVYASDASSAKRYAFYPNSIPALTSCPVETAQQCSKFWLPPGDYVFDPDGVSASATCEGDK